MANTPKTRTIVLDRYTEVGDRKYFSNTYVLPASEAADLIKAAGKEESTGEALARYLDKPEDEKSEAKPAAPNK